MNPETTDKARQIRLLILDVDGVLTDGGLQFDDQGRETKTFNSLDGHGIRMLLDSGIDIAIITGRQSTIVERRMSELGVSLLYQGCREKLPVYEKLLAEKGLEPSQVAYAGDDLPDLTVMSRVGLAIAVQNAHAFVRQHCDLVTKASGGRGAVREITDLLLQSQSLLDAQQQAYIK